MTDWIGVSVTARIYMRYAIELMGGPPSNSGPLLSATSRPTGSPLPVRRIGIGIFELDMLNVRDSNERNFDCCEDCEDEGGSFVRPESSFMQRPVRMNAGCRMANLDGKSNTIDEQHLRLSFGPASILMDCDSVVGKSQWACNL